MEKSKVVPPVRIFAPEGAKELGLILAELYFLPEGRAFREEVRRMNPVELSLNRAAPFSFAIMTYGAKYGYWTYGWD